MWKRYLSIAALCATILGGVVAAWPWIEPMMAATRGYARDLVDASGTKIQLAQGKVEQQLHNTQVDVARGKLDSTNNDLFKAQLEYKKTTDPATQEFITNQINKLQATKDALTDQLKTLRAQP